MRFGMSWPTGHGRRAWISMPIWLWLFIAPFWLATWAVFLVVAVLAVLIQWAIERAR